MRDRWRIIPRMVGNVEVLLRKIDEGIASIEARYQHDLDAKAVSDETPV